MLIDLHAHSSGVSRCCKIAIDEVMKQALAHGMDGIFLTNHYQKSYLKDITLDAFVEKYIAEFFTAKELGEQMGCRVFFGIEVTMELYPKVHMLIYGVEPDFLREHPTVFDYTQEELYALVKAHGGVLIQAHPFRNGTTVLDTAFMDGIEINCHPKYDSTHSKELLELAKKEHLLVTCGGDFHSDTHRPTCGMYLPEEIRDTVDFCRYLRSPGEKKLCVQETDSDTCAVVAVK